MATQPPVTDSTTTTTTTDSTTKKEPLKIVGGMTPSLPAFFDTPEQANAFIVESASKFSDWDSHASKMIIGGLDADGDISELAYPTGLSRTMVHVVTNRGAAIIDKDGKKAGTQPATVKAIIIWPVPSIESLIGAGPEDDAARKWIVDKLNTQIAHVTVAKIRDTDNIHLAAKQMPGIVDSDDGPKFDLASFFAQRESAALTATFDALYKHLLDAYNTKSPLFRKFKLNKAEFKKCLESRPYAALVYGPLEDRGDKISYFVMALNSMIKAAKDNGLDPAVLQNWLDNRDKAEATDDSADNDEQDNEAELENLVLTLESPKAEDTATTAEGENENVAGTAEVVTEG